MAYCGDHIALGFDFVVIGRGFSVILKDLVKGEAEDRVDYEVNCYFLIVFWMGNGIYNEETHYLVYSNLNDWYEGKASYTCNGNEFC